MTFCTNCGKSLKPDQKFCGSCGSPISTSVEKTAPPKTDADVYDFNVRQTETSRVERRPSAPILETKSEPYLIVLFDRFSHLIQSSPQTFIIFETALVFFPLISMMGSYADQQVGKSISAEYSFQFLVVLFVTLMIRSIKRDRVTSPTIITLYLSTIWIRTFTGTVTMAFYHYHRGEHFGGGLIFDFILILPVIIGIIIFVRSKWSIFRTRFLTTIIIILFLDLLVSMSSLLTGDTFQSLSTNWGLLYFVSSLEEYTVVLGILLLTTYASVYKRTFLNASKIKE